MANPKIEVTIKATNAAGRTKTGGFTAEYGTDEELFEVFTSMSASAMGSGFEKVQNRKGWGKADKPKK